MFELWARRRPVDGRGFPFEFIFNFDNEDYCFTALDTLDRDVYQEALIVREQRCIMSVEWEQENKKGLRR